MAKCQKKLALKRRDAKKILSVRGGRGVTSEITLKCCNDSMYDGANFSTKML